MQLLAPVHPVMPHDINNTEQPIPFLGENVLVILYLDPDVQGIDDPIPDSLDAMYFPKEQVAVVGIVNCKDTWLPNGGIRSKARAKQERFPDSFIFLDNDRTVAHTWYLGDCNSMLVVMVLHKSCHLKLTQKVSTMSETINSFLLLCK
jgi:predicted transcriptional regulator